MDNPARSSMHCCIIHHKINIADLILIFRSGVKQARTWQFWGVI